MALAIFGRNPSSGRPAAAWHSEARPRRRAGSREAATDEGGRGAGQQKGAAEVGGRPRGGGAGALAPGKRRCDEPVCADCACCSVAISDPDDNGSGIPPIPFVSISWAWPLLSQPGPIRTIRARMGSDEDSGPTSGATESREEFRPRNPKLRRGSE